MTAYKRRNLTGRIMIVDQILLLFKTSILQGLKTVSNSFTFALKAAQVLLILVFQIASYIFKCFCCCCFIPSYYFSGGLTEEEKGMYYRLREQFRKPFDPKNAGHQALLRKLHDIAFVKDGVFPEDRLISDRWKDIGFQSKDPSKDFRSGGLISLLQMIDYAHQSHPNFIRMVNLSEVSRFMFAVTSIRLTSFMREYFKFDSEGFSLDPAYMETRVRRRLKNLCTFLLAHDSTFEEVSDLDPNIKAFSRLHSILLDLHFAAWSASAGQNMPCSLAAAETQATSTFIKIFESKLFTKIDEFAKKCKSFDQSWLTQHDIDRSKLKTS